MRIVVTGARGFVGRALVAALRRDHEIVAVDAAPGGDVQGDLADAATIERAFAEGCDAVVHLATVPGGAAEQDSDLARRVNVEATMALADAAARAGRCPRFVFASSIAVFGEPPPPVVDDATACAPRMLYGAHKAMMELWLDTLTRRGAISTLSLRLPGIVARPRSPSGMKSAFISDLFHALKASEAVTLPVSPDATMWLMSRARVVRNLIHALGIGDIGALTLPALRTTMGDLVAAVALATGASPALARYEPDAAIEAGFGRQPPLLTPRAEQLGFAADDDLDALVAAALATLE